VRIEKVNFVHVSAPRSATPLLLRPHSAAYRLFIGPTAKGRLGSIAPVRDGLAELPPLRTSAACWSTAWRLSVLRQERDEIGHGFQQHILVDHLCCAAFS
jgi:hypothetical protein